MLRTFRGVCGARLSALALVGVLGLGLAACGSPSASDETTSSDKKITLYSGRSETLIKPLLEQFEKATGITVDARYGDTAAMATQLLEEGDKTKADVFLAQDAGALGAVAKKGMFATLPTQFTDRVPAEYRAKDSAWIGVTGRARVIVYNPDLVTAADLPTSVFDVTAPQWKDKLGIAPTNGSFQAFITAIRVQHGDAKAKEFLSGLKSNGAQIREKNGAIVDDVAAGKLALGLVNHYYVYEKAAEAGTPVDQLKAKLHFLTGNDSGGLINVSGVGVLSAAEKDPDVKTFVDYLLGTEAQTFFASKTFEYPLIAGVPTAPGLPSIAELDPPKIDLNDLDSLEQTVALIKESGLA